MRPNKDAPVSKLTGVPGWETDAEEDTLCFYASQVPEEGLIVEIGAEYGRSASQFLASSLKSVKVFSIDLFPYDHFLVGDLQDALVSNLNEAGVDHGTRWDCWRGDSHDAVNYGKWMDSWPREIDLLFVDGDHSYEGVWADIKVWCPHVKVGGVAIFHDVVNDGWPNPHPLHFEVRRAVDELMTSDIWSLEQAKDSIRVYRRLK